MEGKGQPTPGGAPGQARRDQERKYWPKRVESLLWLQGPGEESRGSNGRANEGRGEATGRPGQGWNQDGERK